MKSPIFLFSLPRSGSTLLQRVLMAHKNIASVAESWLMLPFCYANKKEGVLSEYSHATCSIAFKDFIYNLPNKENDYYKVLGDFARILFEKQCKNNEIYFLDKTPRYYFIIPEIAKVFPNAKFIFLFRNPIQVMSSMIQTYGNGKIKNLSTSDRDLKYGPKALSNGYEMLRNRAMAVKYEEYVTNPILWTKKICDYLELDFDENMLSSFVLQDTKGRMGDKKGIKEYNSICNDSLNKWKYTFNTNFRKRMIYRYIVNIEKRVFDTQGYDKDNILREIKGLKTTNKNFLKDRADYLFSQLVRIVKPNIWFSRTTGTWAKYRHLS